MARDLCVAVLMVVCSDATTSFWMVVFSDTTPPLCCPQGGSGHGLACMDAIGACLLVPRVVHLFGVPSSERQSKLIKIKTEVKLL